MILLVRHRYKLYRRFKYDIWLLCFLKKKNPAKSWLIRFFFKLYLAIEEKKYERLRLYVYNLDNIKPWVKKKRMSERFLTLRLTRLYFLTLKDYQFRALFKKASKLDGNLENNYCLLLEGRILSIFYRTNFMSNFFEIIQFIRKKNILIDNKYIIKHLNASVPIYSFVSFNPKFKYRIRRNLHMRLKQRMVLFNTPRFLFVSYFLFFACLCKLPSKKDLIYPVGVDLYRLTGYN